ncbi:MULTISPECIES: M16 family metallopeptidase [Salegentibacter]|jgi:predicted Zn-dependent peptidase|uniref:Predicted Zn-dependent peptidase n=1 Tax=Salegentibacter agarivorans TaxID=345907 RepID=A0A1I2NY86_9FLAO|nr:MULTISPECIES: pitrilysin family protein [Salegentibacter]APS38362.1 peptidase M16 [Salegentibacter sp. T436]SFG06231.1 Predicted Zn-dependent peptidase [Salegentibacter agarivorans]|tara:strand:+ start:528 stop:2588 length:2061 start_codon:yes stop_codon:yes gene_type:complete
MKFNILTLFIACFLTTAAIAQVDRSKQPEPGPAPKINLGQPDEFTLDNGLKVLVVENHKLPRVSASLIIDNKPHAEEKPATAALVSSLLGTGTENMSKDDFNEEIDFLGANVNFGSESVYASSLSKFFPRVMELMAEGALKPKFTPEEFEAEKNKQIESLKSINKDVGSIASRVSAALAYGANHPYGEFATVENTEKVSLEDVKGFYNNYFKPANAYLVIVGDVKTSEVKKLAKKNFGDWKAGAPKEQDLPKVANVNETQINLVDMPNAVQSELRLQNTIDLKMADEDYFPVLVANQILGGSFGSYLNMNLREDKGYTYGARTSTGADKYASRFVAQASVRNAVTDSAIVESLKEIKRIRTEPVDAEMLENAKSKFAGDFVLRLEQPSTIANYALNIKTNDLSDDFYETFLEKINAVTADDIQRVANKYYQTDNMRIVVAGKASEIAENLEKVEFNGKTIPVKYYNKLGEEVEKPQAKKVDASVTVEKVYENYIEAVGGRDAVEEVESVVMKAEASVQGMALNLTMKRTMDGKLNQEVSVGGNVMSKQIFDGEAGFVMAQGQKIPYNEDQIKTAKIDANPFPELKVGDATLEGIETVEGVDAYVVALSDNYKAYYNVDSGLKMQTVQTVSQAGQTMSIPTGYSDYQEVEGVKFPFKMTQAAGPQTFEFDVTEILVNEGVSAEDFEE